MTITIDVTEEQAQQLNEEAIRLNLPLSELVLHRLFAPQAIEDHDAAEDFQSAMEYVFSKNSELYRRLA